jgi:RNA polymerase sigma factor (sigma-70 family)
VTQRALLLVYEQIGCCRSPATFLAFALFKLRQALKDEQRARNGDWLPEDLLVEIEANQPETPSAPLLQECRQTLLAAIDRLSNQRQRQVLYGLFFDELCAKEIGARLEITQNHVSVLCHRAVARLGEDSALNDYFASG